MQPMTKLPATLVASSAKRAGDLQLSSEEESEEQKNLSKQPKTTTTLEASSEKLIFNCHHLNNPMMIPNLLPSMRPI
jgi:hypothetical protein